MAILGMGNDSLIQQIVQGVFKVATKKPRLSTPMCDGFILKLHYLWTFSLFLFGFATVWYSWYFHFTIICVSRFNANAGIPTNYLNVCFSYPFVQHETHREYLLYYRWIPITMLTIAAIFYIPRKMSKYSENPKIKQLMEEMSLYQFRFDQTEKQLIYRASIYIAYNIRTHNWLFCKYITCTVLCLIIDIIVFYGLDVFLLGKFSTYGINALPFNRDPIGFSDYISKTFPPFVDCEIGEVHQLLNKRTEQFGCHLPIMEFYEKLFFIIWVWLVLLIVITTIYLIFIMCFIVFPCFQFILLRIPKPPNANGSVKGTILTVLRFCKVGDIYLLYRLKQYSSAAMYYEILNKLTDIEMMEVIKKEPGKRGNVINYKNNKNKDPECNPLTREMSSSDDSFTTYKRPAYSNKSILLP